MKLKELLKAIRPLAIKGAVDGEISGIAYDSRQVRPGYLFVALPGEHADGVQFVDDAVKRGAGAVVSTRVNGVRREVAAIQVNDPRLALAELAAALYQYPSRRLQVAGVTGTNGKTTVACMLRNLLAAAGRRPGLLGTIQYEIGARTIPATRTTPEAADIQAMFDQMLQAGCRSVAMEVSSHALAQKRVWGVDFDVGVFTNLTRDHLDYHHTEERYFQAKAELFRELGRGGKTAAAVLNADDPRGRELAALVRSGTRVVTYGVAAAAMVKAEDLRLTAAGSVFRVATPWGHAEIRLRLLGRFNVYNALAALAAGGCLGLELSLIADVLGKVEGVPGRLEEIKGRQAYQVFVDYAHTDDALENILVTLREITRGRLLVVFGCGGTRDKTKRPRMGAVAARRADYAVVTSDNPRKEPPLEIIAQIEAGFGANRNYEVVEDRAQAIAKILALARPGDVVVIAGKGHESYQEFANTIVPFDDRQVVRSLLS